MASVAGRWREQQRHDMGRVESGVDEMKVFKMLFVCFASFDSHDNLQGIISLI